MPSNVCLSNCAVAARDGCCVVVQLPPAWVWPVVLTPLGATGSIWRYGPCCDLAKEHSFFSGFVTRPIEFSKKTSVPTRRTRPMLSLRILASSVAYTDSVQLALRTLLRKFPLSAGGGISIQGARK